jgi:excisionase family DNA binding protein
MSTYGHAYASPDFDPSEGLVTAQEVGARLRVSPDTVWRWARNNRVPCMRTPGGDWRFGVKWLRELEEERNGQ